jgi:hypothetical protein
VLLIFGVRVCYWTIAQGAFYCDRCGGDRPCRQRAGRRWLTLIFLPVIPLNSVGDHVQCRTCRTRYETGVLAVPTAAQMLAALPAGIRAAASVILRADGPPSPAARQRAIAAVVTAGMPGYNQTILNGDLNLPSVTITSALKEVGEQLTIQAREWYLADVIRIVMSDGPLTEGERQAAVAIGLDLGMTLAQSIGVIAATEHSAGRG